MIHHTIRMLTVITSLAAVGSLAACSQGPGQDDAVAVDGDHISVSAAALAVGVHSYSVHRDTGTTTIDALDAHGAVVGRSVRGVSYDASGAMHSSLRITQGALVLEREVTVRAFADRFEVEGLRDGKSFSMTLAIGADGALVDRAAVRAEFAELVPEARLAHWAQVRTDTGNVHPAMRPVCRMIGEAFTISIAHGDYGVAQFCVERWHANDC